MARTKKIFTGKVSDVDLRLMRVFKTVIECGGLSAAQTELGIGRSTISRQLSDFETRLGLRLCHRGRSGFQLTQQGKQTLEYVDLLLKSVDEFTTNIASINNRLVGEIDIGMIDYTVSDQRNPLIAAIREFKTLASGVTINLMSGTPSEVERGVIDGCLHIGVVPDYQRHPSLQYTHLYHEEAGLFCGGNHPVAKAIAEGNPLPHAEICKHALVFRGYHENEALRNMKQQFPVGSKAYQTEAVLALVQSGVYLGFFPTHCLSAMVGKNYEVLPDTFRYSSSICAIWRKNRNLSLVLQDFMRLLLNNNMKLEQRLRKPE